MKIIIKTTLEQAIEDLKMIAKPDNKNFELNQLLSDDIEIVLGEIERLKKKVNYLITEMLETTIMTEAEIDMWKGFKEEE